MWTKMETAYSESAADSAPLLWSQFYGCKFLPGQTVVEFITEIEHVVSRLRTINGIVLLDDQIIAKATMSLPPILKLIFKAAWESTAAAERTLRNLTTRLVQMEKEVKESEKEKESDALLSKRVNPTTSFEPRDENKEKGRAVRACWECDDTSHVRSNCRDYKRKLKRQREEEDDDRSRKRRRWDGEDGEWRRSDNNQKSEEHDRDSRDRGGGRDYGNNNRYREDREHRKGNGNGSRKNPRREEHGRHRGYSYSAATSERIDKPTEWFADSGATQHMTGNQDLLVNFVPAGPERWMVSRIGESELTVAGQGDVSVKATVNGITLERIMRGVLLVPGLGINLYSIGSATDAGVEVHFANNTVTFSHNNVIIMEGRRSGKEALYHLNIKASEGYRRTERVLKGVEVEPLSLWHLRFGHLNSQSLLKMASMGSVKGLGLFKDQLHSAQCHGCLQGKMCRTTFPSKRTKTRCVGELIHSDVCGPMQVTTPIGERYYVVFKDDFSGWCEIKLLKKKSEVSNAFKNFYVKVEAETGKKVKTLKTDGGGEYGEISLKDWLAKTGIAHRVTPPYTPQLNGVAERSNRTIVESARSQMYGRKVPLELWGQAVQCAAYVQNRASTRGSYVTPYELWFKKKPDVSQLKVFGCRFFVHVPKEKRKKARSKGGRGHDGRMC